MVTPETLVGCVYRVESWAIGVSEGVSVGEEEAGESDALLEHGVDDSSRARDRARQG